ncbi:hypothetical protein OROMI_032779 [Orobanche minor]
MKHTWLLQSHLLSTLPQSLKTCLLMMKDIEISAAKTSVRKTQNFQLSKEATPKTSRKRGSQTINEPAGGSSSKSQKKPRLPARASHQVRVPHCNSIHLLTKSVGISPGKLSMPGAGLNRMKLPRK